MPLPPTPPAPAQISYTTNTFASPEFLGLLGTVAALIAGKLGLTIPALDLATQQMLAALVGMALTALAHWAFPSASGRLGLTAPAPWAAPAPQDIPVGPSVVTVPHPHDEAQVATVTPIDVGTPQTAKVTPATSETLHEAAAPATVEVVPVS